MRWTSPPSISIASHTNRMPQAAESAKSTTAPWFVALIRVCREKPGEGSVKSVVFGIASNHE